MGHTETERFDNLFNQLKMSETKFKPFLSTFKPNKGVVIN